MEDRPLNRDTRRFHRKSRNGCMQCKQRHVKCDENKPSCGNCAQTNRACSFLRMLPSIPTSLGNLSSGGISPAIYPKQSGPPTPASAPSPSALFSSCTSSTATTPTIPLINIDTKLFNQYNSTQTPEFTLADLSMMHVWATETSLTLSPAPEVQQVWARTITQIALQHRFLLHGILATSALHVAYTKTSSTMENRELVDYAARHQAIALNLFQKALANPVSGGGGQQQEALFVLSVLISVIAIATLRDEISDAMEIDIITTRASGAAIMDFKWIRLSRGILVLNKDHLDELARSSVSPLMRSDVVLENGQWQDKHLADDLRNLQRLWYGNEDFAAGEDDEKISEADRKVFDDAYFALLSIRSKVSEYLYAVQSESDTTAARNHPLGASTTSKPCLDSRTLAEVFMWLIRIPEGYIELLERQHPVALIILAHYAALLGKDCATWWSDRSAYMIIRRVWVVLDERLRKWIESPMDDVCRANG
ncbi:conserved hypothetical protein [Talaromyces stipitatus ATCC 10500]|uniref:Zn(2)-C6 fungal-type domain-containing protein n=1 Tax=Talaromyces stipitatus (strain ATCC 10500 / CBS 375.48 / QM 6759 / NRRL 1006) TaxID=441959 RepID=B8MAB0_TALSN|nr:uncharacterized protein TSTA_123450 [Talaromyces stipitatus ATCC 10500]EED18612.1 conserved hypothetical protein [Talaromyces stipitatus ATCC 10500]